MKMSGIKRRFRINGQRKSTPESTPKRNLLGILSKNSKNYELKSKRFSEWNPRSVRLTRTNKSKTYDCERNLSPVIFTGNQIQ